MSLDRIVVAMVLGFSLQQLVTSSLLYLGLARQQSVLQGKERLSQQLPGRIAVLLDVLDATPDTERATVIAAAQRPQVHVRILDAPLPNLTNRPEPNADLLRRRIEAVLTVPRPIIVADRYRPVAKQAGPVAGRIENGVLIEAALSDGRWLLFESNLDTPLPIDPVAAQFRR